MIDSLIQQIITTALEQLSSAENLPLPDPFPAIKVEAPRDPSHGDYATNVAMALAKPFRLPPAQIAQRLLPYLQQPLFESVTLAGPGFLNFRLAWPWLREQLATIPARDRTFGRAEAGDGHRYLLEFVSANPTGPLHFGHGRWAVLGDCLARLLRVAGDSVDTEFYINDAGAQIFNLGQSVQACYYQILLSHDLTFPAKGHTLLDAYQEEKERIVQGELQFYHGVYVSHLAQNLFERHGDSLATEHTDFFADFARAAMLEQQQQELANFGVDFSTWYSERELHQRGAVEEALTFLEEQGQSYSADGAVWFRSSAYGDDKDKVLVKSDGSRTYFAADIAYHLDKYRRGYDRLINIWGADHHGYIPRMKAAVQALGYPAESLEVLLGQMVNVLRSGELVRMSKRSGDMVSFADVLEEVGKDATRYLLMQRSPDTTLDFDLTLAKEASADNPVFYVQYAHARICSIFRTAQGQTAFPVDEAAIRGASLKNLNTTEERALILKLLSYPDEILFAARQREPHRLTRYAQELATLFHQFYKQCRVLNADEPAVTLARLYLILSVRIVLRNLLEDVFGISAPERM